MVIKMDKIYEFITKVQSIAKIGKLFSKDGYALENYEELEKLSHDALEEYTGVKMDRANMFARDIYPTPNISCRALIFNEKKELLLVKEASLGTWSLPGGWCDLYETPKEAITKECLQEAGCDVEVERLLMLTNRKSYLKDPALSEFVVVFLAHVIKDHHTFCHEVSEVGYFSLDNLPTLSHKTTIIEIKRALKALEDNRTDFD